MMNKIKALLELIPENAECLYCIITGSNYEYTILLEQEFRKEIECDMFIPKTYLGLCYPLSCEMRKEVDINKISTSEALILELILKWESQASAHWISGCEPLQTNHGDRGIVLYRFAL